MVGRDNVLITIMTAANMGGIEQAKAGLLGLNAATLGLTVAVAGAVMAGKSMIDIAEKQDAAHRSLAQAVESNNASLGKQVPIVIDVTKQQDALTIAHNAAIKAEIALTDARERHGKKSQQAYLAELSYTDALIHDKAAQEALTAARAAGQPAAEKMHINLGELQAQIDNFIKSNRSYVSSQSEVEDGYGALIRAGIPLDEVQKDMNRAVDLAALKGISLSDATGLLIKAEQGRMRGLIDLGISTGKYTDAQGNLVNGTKDVSRAMAEFDEKTKKGRDTLTEVQQISNRLSNDWQDLATRGGPILEKELGAIIGLVDAIYNAFDRIGKDDALWGAISDRLVKMAQGLRQAALSLGIAQPGSGDFKPGTDAYNAENAKEYSQAYTSTPGAYLPAGSGAPYGFDPRNGFAWAGYGSGPGQTRPPSNPGFGIAGGRASGGPVLPGGSYTVGESGPETLLMGSSGGFVVPHGQSRGGNQVYVILQGIYAGDGPSLDILANRIALRLGYATGR